MVSEKPITTWSALTWQLFSLSCPNIFLYVIQMMIPFSTTYFIGHLGSVPLAAACLGNMICNTSGMSLGVGLSQALDSLSTQAFGAKQYRLVGLHCQRAMVICTVACIPITLLWCFTEPLLVLVGVDADVAKLSGTWTMWMIPGVWPALQLECFKRYLLAQSITWPQTVSVVFGAGSYAFFSWLLIKHLDIGFEGAPLMVSISYWVMLILTLFFTIIDKRYFLKSKGIIPPGYSQLALTSSSEDEDELSSISASEDTEVKNVEEQLEDEKAYSDETESSEEDPNETWPVPSWDIFRDWDQFLKIGIPASLSLFVEWGSCEVNAFFVAQFGSQSLATHAIAANIVSIWYMPALGISAALTTIVGTNLGSNRPDLAKVYSLMALGAMLVFSIINGGLSLTYRKNVGYLFSEDEEVVNLLASVIFILLPYHIADLQKCVCCGILRGCGRVNVTMIGNSISTLLVGYPMAYTFAWVLDMKITGIWISMTIAWSVATLIYLVFILRLDWDQEAKSASQRVLETHTRKSRTSLELV